MAPNSGFMYLLSLPASRLGWSWVKSLASTLTVKAEFMNRYLFHINLRRFEKLFILFISGTMQFSLR